MRKVREKINADKIQFRYSNTNEEENKCLFGLLYFRGLYHDAKQPTRELRYDNFSARNVYRAAMSLDKCEWLMRIITFHDHSTVRADFLDDRFARMRWFLTEFENHARKYYRHTEFAAIGETLQNFYASHNYNLKVYMKDKPGYQRLLCRMLSDAQDR